MFAPGTYHGYLQSAVTTEAKTGNLQIALVFAVRNQWIGGEWEDVNEEERCVYLSLTDAASPYTEKKLAALGFNGDFMDPQFDDAVANEGVDLKCTASTYNGKATEKWELAGCKSLICKSQRNLPAQPPSRPRNDDNFFLIQIISFLSSHRHPRGGGDPGRLMFFKNRTHSGSRPPPG